jgi:hypothetical protein
MIYANVRGGGRADRRTLDPRPRGVPSCYVLYATRHTTGYRLQYQYRLPAISYRPHDARRQGTNKQMEKWPPFAVR